MAWLLLVIAGLGEVVGVLGINRWNSRKDAGSAIMLGGGFAVSLTLLSIAMKTIPMGTAYAIWTAIGSIGATILGMLFYGESREKRRILFLALVVASAVGLKFVGH